LPLFIGEASDSRCWVTGARMFEELIVPVSLECSKPVKGVWFTVKLNWVVAAVV
jgi:hypothetical protein